MFSDLDTLNSVVFKSENAKKRAVVVPRAYSPFGKTIQLSYQELSHIVTELSTQNPFSSLNPKQVVTFLIPNSLEFVATFFAITQKKCIAAPLNPNYKPQECEFYINDTQSKVLVALKGTKSAETARFVAEKMQIPLWEVSIVQAVPSSQTGSVRVQSTLVYMPETMKEMLDNTGIRKEETVRGSDIALFLHTSGTTGRPKGVPLSHTNILTSMHNIRSTYALTPSDTTYLVMPLFHVHGLIGVLFTSLYTGSTIVIPPKFSVKAFWKDMNEWKCTWYSAVPTIHQMLLSKAKEDFAGCQSLRFIRSCSASLAPATLLELELVFNVPVIESYAMTENAHQMTSNFLPPGERKPGSVGKGRGVDVVLLKNGKLVPTGEVGEVSIRGRSVFSGYHNNPKATAESFVPDPTGKGGPYFLTGDLGYKDKDGFIFLIGRVKEQINRGGEKISPLEIDNILLEHPAVSEAIAFGVKDKLYGEVVHAAVVLRPESFYNLTNHQTVEQDLQKYCKAHLAEFKVPKRVWVLKELPKGATGKIQRRTFSEMFGKKVEEEEKSKAKAKL